MYGLQKNKSVSTLFELEKIYLDEYCVVQCSLHASCDGVKFRQTGNETKMCVLLYLNESGVIEADVFEKLWNSGIHIWNNDSICLRRGGSGKQLIWQTVWF